MNIFLNINSVIFGNDIVDLMDDDCSIEHLNSRFINKISTLKEKKDIFNDQYEKNSHNFIKLWKLWSLKESAYKTISRIYYIPVFRYKDYEVQDNFTTVKYNNISLKTQIFMEHEFLFTITFLSGMYDLIDKNPLENYSFFSFIKFNNENRSHSKEIRNFIQFIFKKFLNKNVFIYRHYDIQHKIRMPPFLYLEQNFYPVSLSHHGRFLAFTIIINSEKDHFFCNFFLNLEIKKINKHYLIFLK